MLEQSITCNGRFLKISNNLYNALYYAIERRDTEALWVDAVCNNQGNKQEGKSQVALMYDIYGRAIRTVAWLGIEDEDLGPALKLVHRLAPFISRLIDQGRIDELHEGSFVEWAFSEKYGL